MSYVSYLVALPIIVPLATAGLLFALQPVRHVQRVVSVASASVQLALAIMLLATVSQQGILAAQMGSWPAPFGITLVADHLSAIMVVITGIMGTAVAVYSLTDIDEGRERFGYHPFYHVLLAGISGAFLTGDLFNLYVWFEVLLIASFVLIALGGDRDQLEGGIKYVLLNLVSSSLFLASTGILYGLTGTLNMADLSLKLAEVPAGVVTTVAILFMVAFGIKAAVFPLFFWLPASYHTPPVAVSAIFAGMLTKVGVYALIRVFTLLFTQDVGYTHTILLVVAGLTMLTGVLGAAAQDEFRRILSFHIISQIGYMIMGLALYTPLALIGAVFYVVHHIIVKTNLFLVSGIAKRFAGSFELKHIGGLYKHTPFLAVLFVVPAFSLAGFPPLSGFWAKLILIRAGLEAEQYVIVFVALLVGLLTMYSMTKIWRYAFWKPHPEGEEKLEKITLKQADWLLYAPVIALAVMTLVIGFWTEPFYNLAERAATELLEPSRYIEAVLGPQEATTATPVTIGETP
ncbi:MAG: Na+/H+ antiporter subunit D [Trueperaceae bacterium]|nr:Na+/H+ antiporter subunit D [Trueperaceae bacterium]